MNAIILLIMPLLVITPTLAISPYQSGYRYGVNDADLSSNDSVNGKSHTQAFRHGCIDGYCSVMDKSFESHVKCLAAAGELTLAVKHPNYSTSKGLIVLTRAGGN